MQCVKSAKDESYGPVCGTFRDHAVITVICAPDDGWNYLPKHVEKFTEKYN